MYSKGFNPSRGIAIIQTFLVLNRSLAIGRFQSLTRDSNHSNYKKSASITSAFYRFQSLTRDSNHSNALGDQAPTKTKQFQSLTRDSNHSNPTMRPTSDASMIVSIPHAG